MKTILLSFLFTLALSLTSFAQYGLTSLGVGAIDHVEVLHNEAGLLDAGNGFTFEAWILNFGGGSNQKVAGKLVSDFKNGFIYGIEDLQVNMEVFDDNGTNTRLKAGAISAIGWTHVAGSYEVGGMLSIFVNGVKVGETPASAVPVNPNLNPFRIGIAPWDVNALGFVGYLDEVRYWQAVLDEAAIRAWMHKDVTEAHPNYDNLTLYHKYNEEEGLLAEDASGNLNAGILSDESITREFLFLPFKGEADLLDNGVQGVWNAKTEATSDILTVSGTFFDTLELEASMIFGHSDGGYSFDTDAPGSYDRSLSRVWQAATQGGIFADLIFDLSPIDMSQVEEVVLLAGPDEDLSSADVFSGELEGNTFTVEEMVPNDGWYYSLGFKTTISSTNALTKNAFSVAIAPNPTAGLFRLDIQREQPGPLQLRVLNATGKEVYRRELGQLPAEHSEMVELGHLPAGTYFVELSEGSGVIVERLMLK